MATYYPKQPPRIYWDAQYAAATRWNGIVAPPDFNPFAWPVERPQGGSPGLAGRRPDDKPLTGMNGGQTDTYGAPMRPRRRDSARSRLLDWWETRRALGPYPLCALGNRVAQPKRRTGEDPNLHQHPLLIQPGSAGGRRWAVAFDDVQPGDKLPAWSRRTSFAEWNRYAAVNEEFVPFHMDDEAGRRAGNEQGAFGMGNLRYATSSMPCRIGSATLASCARWAASIAPSTRRTMCSPWWAR